MQIGLRLHDAIDLPLEARLKEVRRQGFSCGHLALSKVIKEFPVSSTALTPGLAMYLRELFRKKNLDIAVLGCYLNLATPDEEQLMKIMESYMSHIRFASHLGCGVVGTETGAPNVAYKYEPACHTEKALNIFIKNLRPVVDYAESMGVIFAIEPVWNHIVYNAERARRVLDEIASPNLQIILDPVNLLSIENYKERDHIVDEAINLLGKDVAVVHIKDFVVKDNQLVSVAAGEGEMNYQSIMSFIKTEKPFIHVTLENTIPENAVRARKYIEDIWDNV